MNIMQLHDKALDFAKAKHEGQIRKYTGTPYLEHPLEVAIYAGQWAREYFSCCPLIEAGQRYYPNLHANDIIIFLQIVALLHDVMEDCGVTKEELEEQFCPEVADGVWWLSEDQSLRETHNRQQRKEISHARLKMAPLPIRYLKVLDILHNMRSILIYDPNFLVVFTKEVNQLCYDGLFLAGIPKPLLNHFEYVMTVAKEMVQHHLNTKDLVSYT